MSKRYVLPSRPPDDAKRFSRALHVIAVLAADAAGSPALAKGLTKIDWADFSILLGELTEGPLIGDEVQNRGLFELASKLEPFMRIAAHLDGLQIFLGVEDEWAIGDTVCVACHPKCTCRRLLLLPAWLDLRQEFDEAFQNVRPVRPPTRPVRTATK